MNTEIHKIFISINVTTEQLKATDDLYEVIAPELKKDEEAIFKFKAFFASRLTGNDLIEQFAKILQPKIAKLANDLDHRLTLPLYAALAKHISNEWVQEAVGNSATPDERVIEVKAEQVPALMDETNKIHAAIDVAVEVGGDQFLAGITAREVGMPAAIAAPYTEVTNTRATSNNPFYDSHEASTFHPSIFTPPEPTTHAELPPGFKGGSAGQDRSKPVLTNRVLRGLDLLADKLMLDENGHSESMPELSKGSRDARTALLFIARTAQWGREKDKI